MALLSGKPGRFRVVLAQYVSRHKTAAEASAALKKVKLKGDDLTFVIEEPDNANAKPNSKSRVGRLAR